MGAFSSKYFLKPQTLIKCLIKGHQQLSKHPHSTQYSIVCNQLEFKCLIVIKIPNLVFVIQTQTMLVSLKNNCF